MAALDIATGFVLVLGLTFPVGAVGFASRKVDLVLFAVHQQNDKLRAVERQHGGPFARDHTIRCGDGYRDTARDRTG